MVLSNLNIVIMSRDKVASVNNISLGVERKLGVRVQNESGVRMMIRLAIILIDSIIL